MAGGANLASWITTHRVRVHGTLLALCLWSLYSWNMATPGLRDRAGNLKGTDFLHLYTLGSLALAHRGADLYNMQAQTVLSAQRVPAAVGIRYLPLYPPQVSIFLAPFAQFSYGGALVLWLVLSAGIYASCVYAVWRACPALRNELRAVWILALAFPAFWHLILWGQTSALALAGFTLGYLALRNDRGFLAGLAFGCLIFKPQLGIAAAVIFLATGGWKVIAGGLLSAAAQLAAAWTYYGSGPLREWILALFRLPGLFPLLEPKPYQTHCLRSFWTMLLPWPRIAAGPYIVTVLLALVLAARCWNSRISLPLRYSALLLATVLVAPHLTVYDLVILGPAFLLLADWCIANFDDSTSPSLKILLYAAYALPLVGPLARWTHVQLTVPVMFLILYLISQIGRRSAHSAATA